MTKEELKRVLDSEIFTSDSQEYPQSVVILEAIKQIIVSNMDKPNVDLKDLVYFSISSLLYTILKIKIDKLDLSQALENTQETDILIS